MGSRALLRRLDRLRLPAEKEPKLVHDFGVLSRVENARFWELYYMLRDGEEELTEAETKEFWLLLHRCPLVDPSEAGNPHAETDDERRERRELQWVFAGAFHDYARHNPDIAIPNYANELNEYRLAIGYQLFVKYGWIARERDCAAIAALDQWEPDDREALIDLYQRANPECSSMNLPGWKSKHRPGRVVTQFEITLKGVAQP
jgi:hypothetical protein